jgi:hypothetical protein
MLEFRFQDFLNEIDHFRIAASDLLDPTDSDSVLLAFKSRLENIRQRHDIADLPAWELSLARPLRTRVSKGEYEAYGRIGRHYVQASISSTWKIQPARPKKPRTPSETFSITGLASARVEFHDCCKDTECRGVSLGSWRMELATTNASDEEGARFPGCFFHASVLGEATNEGAVFPKSLSVPRLPSIMFSPISVAEYVLGELFQDEWTRPERHARPSEKQLASIQRDRLRSLLKWQLNLVEKVQSTTPWLVLKRTPPNPTMFST